jgi:squalene synthase HpnC
MHRAVERNSFRFDRIEIRSTNYRQTGRIATVIPNRAFLAELELYGPEATGRTTPTLAESQRYCHRLATRHYENFTVASFLLPRRLRQHFYNVYAYCRWADDLADETGSPEQGLALLDWWNRQLCQAYEGDGRASHPVFVALTETIRRFQIPVEPLAELLVAFRQDQRVARYETFDEVLGYCRYSANPVGRIVLCLGECLDARRAELSDSICTGLQLANFCQDVARDWERGRIYLAQSRLREFGYDEAMFARREYNEPFRRLMEAETATAESWLRRGLPLVAQVPRWLALDVALFIHGGLAILEAIRGKAYDVWSGRPTLSKGEKLRLAAETWWKLRRGRLIEKTA